MDVNPLVSCTCYPSLSRQICKQEFFYCHCLPITDSSNTNTTNTNATNSNSNSNSSEHLSYQYDDNDIYKLLLDEEIEKDKVKLNTNSITSSTRIAPTLQQQQPLQQHRYQIPFMLIFDDAAVWGVYSCYIMHVMYIQYMQQVPADSDTNSSENCACLLWDDIV